MTGIEMMLKSMGIDKEQIFKGVANVVVAIKEIDDRMKRIEQKLDLVLELKNGDTSGSSVDSSRTNRIGESTDRNIAGTLRIESGAS